MGGDQSGFIDYDVLLCLGLSNRGLEWWIIPGTEIDNLIEEGVITSQHGGSKMSSGTYWLRMRAPERERLQAFASTSERLRAAMIVKYGQT